MEVTDGRSLFSRLEEGLDAGGRSTAPAAATNEYFLDPY